MHGVKSLKMQPKSFKNPNQPNFLNTEVFAAEKRNALYWLQPPVQGQGGREKHKQKTLCKTAWNSLLIPQTYPQEELGFYN